MSYILVPLDGSELAERAVPLATYLARSTGDVLMLLQSVHLPIGEDAMESWLDIEQATQDYLRLQVESLTTAGVAAASSKHIGMPADAILDETRSTQPSAIVMATHGRDGLQRAVLGSVAEQVMREAPAPIFLLPAAAERQAAAPIRRIAVALDGSDLAEAVVEPVSRIARKLGAAVTLLHVHTEQDDEVEHAQLEMKNYLAPLAARLRESGLEAAYTGVVAADPAPAILKLASLAGVDLLAMASHGRTGLDRLRHGSVTEHVLRHSPFRMLVFGRAALRRLADGERRIEAPVESGPLGERVSGAGD
jgi:nucleotide-binding universal stress UspA family protein